MPSRRHSLSKTVVLLNTDRDEGGGGFSGASDEALNQERRALHVGDEAHAKVHG